MPTALNIIQWFPSQGLDLQRPKHMVPLTMASDGEDFIVEDAYRAKKRDGFEKVTSSQITGSASVTMLESLNLSNGTSYNLVKALGEVYLETNGVLSSAIITGQDYTNPWEFCQFLDYGLFVNASAKPFFFDGTVSGAVSAAPSGAASCGVHLNRLFLFISNTSMFQYSAVGDFNVWTGNSVDTINVEQNNGQVIVGGKTFSRNELVIFKEDSMFKFIGNAKNNFNLVSIDSTVGCSGIRTVQNFRSSTQGGLMIWAYRDGLYVYDGTTPKKISQYIQSFWDTLNATRFKWCDSCIDLDKGRYILAVSEGSGLYNTKLIVVDLLHPWTDDLGLHFPIFIWNVEAQSLVNERVSSSDRERISFGGRTGYKYQFSSAKSDDGVAIDSYFVSPLYAFTEGLGRGDCLRRIWTTFDTTAGEVDVYTGITENDDYQLQESVAIYGDSAAIGIDFEIGVSPIGIPDATFVQRINTQTRSPRVKIKFQQNSATRTYAVQAPIELWFKEGR